MSFLRGDYATTLGRQSELACLTEVHPEKVDSVNLVVAFSEVYAAVKLLC